jgi:hypothetical protein
MAIKIALSLHKDDMLSFAILKGPISNFNLEISLGFIDNAGQFCSLGQNLDFYSHNLRLYVHTRMNPSP